MPATQKGLFLRAQPASVSEVPLPQPPADHNTIQPSRYAESLQVRALRHPWLLSGCRAAPAAGAATTAATPLPIMLPATHLLHLHLRQAADPEHLLLAAVPFSELAGKRVVLVYDASSAGAPNQAATRLTTGVEDGLEVQASRQWIAVLAVAAAAASSC